MEKYTAKYNDWEYELLYENGDIPKLNVKPNKSQEKPKSLSKYYSLNENNVLAFLNNEFYVSQPDQLNDLFDSSLSLISFKDRPFSHFIKFLKDINADIKQEEDRYNDNPKKYLQIMKHYFYRSWLQITGILCMTDDTVNELMWAHYTNNEGFLIEFDYTRFGDMFMGPYPINYNPPLTPVDFGKMDNNLGFFISSLIKKDIWSYEKEYRFLCISEDEKGYKVSGTFDNSTFHQNLQTRFISYPKESIKKIILGFAFFKNEIDRQKANYSERKYDVIFAGGNATIKILLFNYLIKHKIPVELMVFDKLTFELKTIPISISKISESKYSIKELH